MAIAAGVAAAGIAAAASVGSAAIQAANSPDLADLMPGQSATEKKARGKQLLQAELAEKNIQQSSRLQSRLRGDLFELAGFEAETRRNPAIAKNKEKLERREAKRRKLFKRKRAIEKTPQGERTPAQLQRLKDLNREIEGIDEKITPIKDQLRAARQNPEQLRSVGLPDADSFDTNTIGGRNQAIAAELQSRVLSALQGEVTDPRLEKEIEDQRRIIEEQLRRRFGADFRSATPAIRRLAEFDTSTAIAESEVGRSQIREFLPLSLETQRVDQGLRANQIGLATGLAEQPLRLGQARQSLSGTFGQQADSEQRGRLALFGAALQESRRPDPTAQIVGGIGNAFGVLGGSLLSQPVATGGGGSSSPSQSFVSNLVFDRAADAIAASNNTRNF